MSHLGTNSTTFLDTHSTPEPSVGSIHQLSLTLRPSPLLTEESLNHFDGWKTIGGRGFSDEVGFLSPRCHLTREKLKDRKEEDVVIFNYSWNRVDGYPPVEGRGPSSGSSGEDDYILFQVLKDRLIESEKFNRVINPPKQPQLIQSWAWLAIM